MARTQIATLWFAHRTKLPKMDNTEISKVKLRITNTFSPNCQVSSGFMCSPFVVHNGLTRHPQTLSYSLLLLRGHSFDVSWKVENKYGSLQIGNASGKTLIRVRSHHQALTLLWACLTLTVLTENQEIRGSNLLSTRCFHHVCFTF